jgi:hypothetical protein
VRGTIAVRPARGSVRRGPRPDPREARRDRSADRSGIAAAPFTGDAPIPGTTSLVHLDENLAAEEVSLTDDEFDAIALLVPEDEQGPTSA